MSFFVLFYLTSHLELLWVIYKVMNIVLHYFPRFIRSPTDCSPDCTDICVRKSWQMEKSSQSQSNQSVICCDRVKLIYEETDLKKIWRKNRFTPRGVSKTIRMSIVTNINRYFITKDRKKSFLISFSTFC